MSEADQKPASDVKNEQSENSSGQHQQRDNRRQRPNSRRGGRNTRHQKRQTQDRTPKTPEEHLSEMKVKAADAIKEVKRWGEEVRLPPIDSNLQGEIEHILKADPEISYSPRCAAGKTSFVIKLGK